jgi:hypothetical protein
LRTNRTDNGATAPSTRGTTDAADHSEGGSEFGTGETSLVLQDLVRDSPDVEESLTRLARRPALIW